MRNAWNASGHWAYACICNKLTPTILLYPLRIWIMRTVFKIAKKSENSLLIESSLLLTEREKKLTADSHVK